MKVTVTYDINLKHYPKIRELLRNLIIEGKEVDTVWTIESALSSAAKFGCAFYLEENLKTMVNTQRYYRALIKGLSD